MSFTLRKKVDEKRDPGFDWQEGLVTLEELVAITRLAKTTQTSVSLNDESPSIQVVPQFLQQDDL